MLKHVSIPLLDEGMVSHPGQVRAENEDSLGSFHNLVPSPTSRSDARMLAQKGLLYVVADGMGGHERGAVASVMAVEHLCSAYYGAPGDDAEANLRHAIERANEAIYAAARTHARPGARPMGTTAVCAVVRGDRLTLAHIGDSRAYLMRNGELTLLTSDHDWTTEQMRRRGLSRAEAEQLALEQGTRSTLMRALGAQPSAQPDIASFEWHASDVLLLCSDGLYRSLPNERIAALLVEPPAPLAASKLVTAANAAGGQDNITALVVRGDQRGAPHRFAPHLLQYVALAAALVLLLLGLRTRVVGPLPSVNGLFDAVRLPTLAPTVALLPTASAAPTDPPTAQPSALPSPTLTQPPSATRRPASAPPTRIQQPAFVPARTAAPTRAAASPAVAPSATAPRPKATALPANTAPAPPSDTPPPASPALPAEPPPAPATPGAAGTDAPLEIIEPAQTPSPTGDA